jgi:hypothetical protein
MGMWQRLTNWRRRHIAGDPSIVPALGGFDVVPAIDGGLVAKVRWSDVHRITAYKIDLLTTDCICLLFELQTNAPPVQISEEWTGFAETLQPLLTAFPSIPTDWYGQAMKPAFERNHRVLFEVPTHRNAASSNR